MRHAPQSCVSLYVRFRRVLILSLKKRQICPHRCSSAGCCPLDFFSSFQSGVKVKMSVGLFFYFFNTSQFNSTLKLEGSYRIKNSFFQFRLYLCTVTTIPQTIGELLCFFVFLTYKCCCNIGICVNNAKASHTKVHTFGREPCRLFSVGSVRCVFQCFSSDVTKVRSSLKLQPG